MGKQGSVPYSPFRHCGDMLLDCQLWYFFGLFTTSHAVGVGTISKVFCGE